MSISACAVVSHRRLDADDYKRWMKKGLVILSEVSQKVPCQQKQARHRLQLQPSAVTFA